MDSIEKAFHSEMIDIYMRAKAEAGYNATRFLAMVNEHGGLETARILLNAKEVSEGYTALWEKGRFDLTVEAVMLEPAWASLFTPTERLIAVRRLKQYGFQSALPNIDSSDT